MEIDATRRGLLVAFYIQDPDNHGIAVTPENADEIEQSSREQFDETYPDLLEEVD